MSTGLVSDERGASIDRWAWLLVLLPVGAVLLLAAALVKSCSQVPAEPHRQVVRITLLPDVAPPPPPPPPVVQRPEPPRAVEAPARPVPVEPPPSPPPIAPAPAPALRMEGTATDAASPFAAGAVTHDYNGQAIGNGTGAGGSGRMQWGLYATQLQRQLQDRLGREAELRNSSYRCTLRVWLTPDGNVERAEGQTSGDTQPAAPGSEACAALTQALLKLGRVADAPPAGLPQPVVLRIANKRSAN